MEQIEVSILKGLLYDEDYARKVIPHLKQEFFEGETKTLFNIYSTFFNQFNKIPNEENVAVALQKSKLDEQSFGACIDVLETCSNSKNIVNDTNWLVNETEEYCKTKAIYDSIYKSISILDGNDKDLTSGMIPTMLEKALAISFNTTIGSDYIDNALERYQYYISEESKLAFKLNALNILTNGGLPKKTLNVILAGTNAGKSALMCFNAAEWLAAGKNVLYLTMEMSEDAIMERVDMNLLDMDSNQLRKMTKDSFESKILKLTKNGIGKLKVKEFATGEPNANHFKAVLKELKQKQNFIPDVIIIDYINICSSVRYSTSGTNSYSYIKAIAEELRGLAVEFDVPILTATQTNREGTKTTDPGMDSISDSFGIAMTADWICVMTATEELVAAGQVLACLLKTRYGNKSESSKMLIGVDYNRMRYKDMVYNDPTKETQEALKSMPKTDKKIAWS